MLTDELDAAAAGPSAPGTGTLGPNPPAEPSETLLQSKRLWIGIGIAAIVTALIAKYVLKKKKIAPAVKNKEPTQTDKVKLSKQGNSDETD